MAGVGQPPMTPGIGVAVPARLVVAGYLSLVLFTGSVLNQCPNFLV